MKRIFSVLVVLAVVSCGCASSENNAVGGAVVGGAVGAGAGAIIGHQSGRAGGGALIGGALGALTGALVGTNTPKHQAAQPSQASGQVNSQQVSIDEIVTMAGQGVNDDVILDKIRVSNSRFTLTSAQVEVLKQKGVSQRVINAMQGL